MKDFRKLKVREKGHHFAMGSANESEYYLLLARDLGLLNSPDYEQLAGKVTEVKRMLTSLYSEAEG